MSNSFDKYQKRRLISSYFSVIISITLVLFLLGVLGMLLINARKVETHFKEQIALSIDLKENVKQIEIDQLEKNLKLSDYVKSTRFISKDEAAEIAQVENGEKFMDFIGYNPFQNSIDVYLNSEFVTLNKLEEIKTDLLQKSYVDEVRYDIDLVSLMNKNVKRISFWLIAISVIFAFIAMLLINSSIRLAVYSKRFIIKTMQMVGATKHFIRRPFIWKSIRLGILGSLLAVAGLVVVAYYLDKNLPELNLLSNPTLFASLCLGVVLLGIVIKNRRFILANNWHLKHIILL
mgnify:FL=1